MASLDNIDKVVENLTPTLSKLWTKHSKAKGWDSGVANSVGVIFSKNDIAANYPTHMADKVDSLEYGDLATKTPPSGALRAFADEANDVASSELAAVLLEVFDSMVAEAL